MKKTFIVFIFIFILFPILVSAEVCQKDDIVISKIELNEVRGNAEETSDPNNDNNQLNLNAKMNVIGDSLTYKVVIKNTSNSDYVFDKNQITKDYINYDISYDDESEIVKAGEEKTIYLRLRYDSKPQADNLSNGLLHENNNVSFNLINKKEIDSLINPETGNKFFFILLFSFIMISLIIMKKNKKITTLLLIVSTIIIPQIVKATCTCSLDINLNIEVDAKEAIFLPGKEVNTKMKQLAGDDTSSVTNSYDFNNSTITAVINSDVEPEDINKEEKNLVSTPDSSYPIYMWFDNGIIYWWSEDNYPSLNKDSSYMFNSLYNLNDISGLVFVDSSQTNNLAYAFFATGLESLEELTNWNVSQVTNLEEAFSYNINLISLSGLEKWTTESLETMIGTFCECTNLSDVSPISNWNVEKVKDISFLFQSCLSIEEIDLSNWNAQSLTNMTNTFGMWTSNGTMNPNPTLKRIILSDKFNTSKVTNMYALLANNTGIEDYSFLAYLDTSNVENMQQMFQHNYNLTDLNYLANWNVSKVTNMNTMFANNINLQSLEGLKKWNTSNVTTMSGMFSKNTNLQSIKGLENWNTSKVTSMSSLFSNDTNLISIKELEKWDTSNVINMSYMFNSGSLIESLIPIKNWNIANVKYMYGMFYGCNTLTEIDLSNWNTSNVLNMSTMFECANVTSINLKNWDTSNVEDMSYMFNSMFELEELDISNFDTRNVKSFRRMFNNSTKLKHIYVGENWSTESNAEETKYVFPRECELPNFSTSNPNFRDIIYAHTGEGGYLTLKIN